MLCVGSTRKAMWMTVSVRRHRMRLILHAARIETWFYSMASQTASNFEIDGKICDKFKHEFTHTSISFIQYKTSYYHTKHILWHCDAMFNCKIYSNHVIITSFENYLIGVEFRRNSLRWDVFSVPELFIGVASALLCGYIVRYYHSYMRIMLTKFESWRRCFGCKELSKDRQMHPPASS